MRKKPGFTIVVWMPNGSSSGASDAIQPSTPNFDAAYALQYSNPASPAEEEIVTTCPERCSRMAGSTARVTFIGPIKARRELSLDLLGRELLEEAGDEARGVVDQDVDGAEAIRRRLGRGLGVVAAGDVELDDQQGVRVAEGAPDGLGVATGGDDVVAGRERGLRDVDAHAAAGAGDEPGLCMSCHVSLGCTQNASTKR